MFSVSIERSSTVEKERKRKRENKECCPVTIAKAGHQKRVGASAKVWESATRARFTTCPRASTPFAGVEQG